MIPEYIKKGLTIEYPDRFNNKGGQSCGSIDPSVTLKFGDYIEITIAHERSKKANLEVAMNAMEWIMLDLGIIK
jgi:hypothetical protein